MDARQRERQVAGLAASHRGLVAMLDELLEEGRLDAAAPSLLPGWTVGHVLTHLARNADSMTRALETSERDEVVERYPGGGDGRNAGIEAGHARGAVDQVADVHGSIVRLDAALAGHSRWDGRTIESSGRVITVDALPIMRWCEVEVHRADLGLGYGFDDWPSELVRTELAWLEMQWRARRPMGLTGLPNAALAVPDRQRLAWLLGRADVEGLGPAGVF